MNRRRIDALERLLGADAALACRCLLIYQAGDPPPPLTGTCPQCRLPRRGAKVIIVEKVGIENREEAEPFGVADRDGQ